jgi:hypothetical protein
MAKALRKNTICPIGANVAELAHQSRHGGEEQS